MALSAHNFPSSSVFWEALTSLANWRTASTSFTEREKRSSESRSLGHRQNGDNTWRLFCRSY